MNQEINNDNVKSFLNIRLKGILNKLEILISSNQCDDDIIKVEFNKLKNELVADLNILYNDDNIKFDFSYDISKNSIESITVKALNNFSYYLLQGYEYDKIKEMGITGDDIITNPKDFYGNFLKNNYRKHEL